MTQASLAMTIGTRERNIIRWENDQHQPRAEFIAAIAKVTGRPIEFFCPSLEVDADTAPFETQPDMSMENALAEIAKANNLMARLNEKLDRVAS